MKVKLLVRCWAMFFMLQAKSSHASGDPVILYWLGSLAIMHLCLFAFLYIKERRPVRKIANLAVYSLLVLLLWGWVMNVKGPDFNMMYTILALFPFAIVIILLKVNLSTKSGVDDNR